MDFDITQTDWASLMDAAAVNLAFLLLYIFILMLAMWLKNLMTPYQMSVELTGNDNPAVGVTVAGYYIAVTLIFAGAMLGPMTNLLQDLLVVGGYTLLGVLFLNAARLVSDKVIFRKFSLHKEIVEDQNVGMGMVSMGTYVATGLIAAASIHGEGGGVVTALAFFVLGQVALLVFSFVYDFLTPYPLHREIEKDNTAAGIAYGGTLVALGIIVAQGASGNFIGWEHNLMLFARLSLAGFIILPFTRLFMDRLVIPGDKLSKEIAVDKNIAAGVIEMAVAISFATIVAVII